MEHSAFLTLPGLCPCVFRDNIYPAIGDVVKNMEKEVVYVSKLMSFCINLQDLIGTMFH